jgi:hypothetical protein
MSMWLFSHRACVAIQGRAVAVVYYEFSKVLEKGSCRVWLQNLEDARLRMVQPATNAE